MPERVAISTLIYLRLSFIEYIVGPLYEAWANLLPDVAVFPS